MSFFKYTTTAFTEAWVRYDRVIALKGRIDKDKVEKTQLLLDSGVGINAQENPFVLAGRINQLREEIPNAPPLLKFVGVNGLSVYVDPRSVIVCEAMLPKQSMILIDGGAVFQVKAALADILPQFANV